MEAFCTAINCQTVVVRTGGVRPSRNRGTATALHSRSQVSSVRSESPASGPATLLIGGAAREHLSFGDRPCCLPYPLPPSFPRALTALWDGNSTPANCGCQELIPIYCISKELTVAMPAFLTHFPQMKATVRLSRSCRTSYGATPGIWCGYVPLAG